MLRYSRIYFQHFTNFLSNTLENFGTSATNPVSSGDQASSSTLYAELQNVHNGIIREKRARQRQGVFKIGSLNTNGNICSSKEFSGVNIDSSAMFRYVFW